MLGGPKPPLLPQHSVAVPSEEPLRLDSGEVHQHLGLGVVQLPLVVVRWDLSVLALVQGSAQSQAQHPRGNRGKASPLEGGEETTQRYLCSLGNHNRSNMVLRRILGAADQDRRLEPLLGAEGPLVQGLLLRLAPSRQLPRQPPYKQLLQ